jgi:hypothetical protein
VLNSEDDEMVEDLITQGPDEPLDVGLHPMGSKCDLGDLSPLKAKCLIHCAAEFRVPIVDNVPDGANPRRGESGCGACGLQTTSMYLHVAVEDEGKGGTYSRLRSSADL